MATSGSGGANPGPTGSQSRLSMLLSNSASLDQQQQQVHQSQSRRGSSVALNSADPNSYQHQQDMQQTRRNSFQPDMDQLRLGAGQDQRRASLTSQAKSALYIKDDIDIVFNKLMALEAFRKLHPTIIRNLCSYAFIERIDKGVIVFRQGDDAINWYALLEGSVDVKVSQSNGQKDDVTLCTLGVGTTFGASVMPGKSHSVSVVTSDECTLLRVRRADFQEIFNEQSHLINNFESSPFCSFASINNSRHCSQQQAHQQHHNQHQQHNLSYQQHQTVRPAARHSSSSASSSASSSGVTGWTSSSATRHQQDNQIALHGKAAQLKSSLEETEEEAPTKQQDADQDDLGDLNLESLDISELSGHLERIGWVLRTLMLHQSPKMLQNRKLHPHQIAKHHQQKHSVQEQKTATNTTTTTVPAHQRRLTSTGSSMQLFAAGANQTGKSAGRKVANYVASSFMRSNSKLIGKINSIQQQPALFSSNSFDSNNNSPPQLQQQQQYCQQRQEQASPSKSHSEPVVFRRSMLGKEMVDWLLELSQSNTNAARFITSRLQAVSMWQVLLEQGVVFSFTTANSEQPAKTEPEQAKLGKLANCCQFQFCDDQQAYYKFWFDRDPELSISESDDTAYGSDFSGFTNSDSQQLRPREQDTVLALDSLWWALKVLSKLAPDACFRLILNKLPHERSAEEVDIVFEELQHLKALSHLTNNVKKELAGCVTSEHHTKQNTVIFNQGDPGQSWYIILRGSVNVVIVGKGVVCTLHDGDDFGKLALVNDAPRAATIVTNEPNCYFLRVDKLNFNKILRDVEANTVRLKEHGKEVLILQKVPMKEPVQPAQQQQQHSMSSSSTAVSSADAQQQQQQPSATQATQSVQSGQLSAASSQAAGGQQQPLPTAALSSAQAAQAAAQAAMALKYMVMAGTAEKMLEHLLETRIDGQTQIGPLLTGKSGLIQHDQVSGFIQSSHGDNFLEDFILTHKIFMPTSNLCAELLKQYQCQTKSQLSSAGSKSAPANGSGAAGNQQQQTGEHASLDDEYLVAKKRRVVKFVRCWMLITREHFFQQQQIQQFLTQIHLKIKQDAAKFCSLQPELKVVSKMLELHLEEDLENKHKGVQRWIDDVYGNILPIRRHSGSWDMSAVAGHGQSRQLVDVFLASLHQRRFELKLSTIQPSDEVVFRVYCVDHSFATLKTRIDEKAAEIKQMAASKMNLSDKELILVHVKSNGEKIIYNDLESNITTNLSVNGRVFVCPLDHISAIAPLPEQDPFQEVYQSLSSRAAGNEASLAQLANGQAALNSNSSNQQQQQLGNSSDKTLVTGVVSGAMNNSSTTATQATQSNGAELQLSASSGISSHLLVSTLTNYNDIKTQMGLSVAKLEEFSSRDVAYSITQLAWSLLKNMHEFELIYTVFGRHNFKQITANLNVFLRHFNEIQYWVVTQICLSTSLSKRVQILRKFIKIAAHCKELQNLNAFFAIIMGLSNMAVARLTQTWEKLPNKLKRTFSQFESLIDPSRNHRRYRIFISKMEPPIIPFMPLFLKDMTFAHEGNKTYLENGLINFEKMQMVAQTLRTIRYCKSKPMKLDSSVCKFKGSIRSIELFFRDLKIIDNQRTLTQMSHQLEHRKT